MLGFLMLTIGIILVLFLGVVFLCLERGDCYDCIKKDYFYNE